ncbi:hypothetical protein AB0E77_22695 [Streptomyces sp. NPDC032940]|uniref:hypothetical protein n=1 Tax=Streptomyces sp. NPDC032940 TaxID=3155366 RepID=UPI003408458D
MSNKSVSVSRRSKVTMTVGALAMTTGLTLGGASPASAGEGAHAYAPGKAAFGQFVDVGDKFRIKDTQMDGFAVYIKYVTGNGKSGTIKNTLGYGKWRSETVALPEGTHVAFNVCVADIGADSCSTIKSAVA